MEVELRGRPAVRATLVRRLGTRIFVALLPKGADVCSVTAIDRNGTVLERRTVSLDARHGHGTGANGYDLVLSG